MKNSIIVNGIKYIRAEEQLKLYDTVKYNGYDWYIIGLNDDSVILLMKECLPVEKMKEIFDEEILDEDFDVNFSENRTSNDWINSIIREGLNKKFIEEFNEEELKKMKTNYDEDKYSEDYIRLLTIRNVDKLPENLRECNKNYWTMSPYLFSTWYADAGVWGVSSTGSLINYWTSYSWLGVRPVINLKSEYLNNIKN